ncbi:MAG: ROK family protein [Candidatus Atribacteria bacterium]|nr:ROK family protein [Candidatus Atribacteria bacterium]
MAVIGIDIGGTKIRMAISDTPTNFLCQSEARISDLGIPISVDVLSNFIREKIKKENIPFSKIQAIGVSVAAVVNRQQGFVKIGENVGWENVPLAKQLEEEFGIPIIVDTDVFCGAAAESTLGNGIDLDNFLYIAIGTGIGHAFVLNREIFRGLHDAASAFGHLKVCIGGAKCYCGQRGCVCQYSSGEGISRLSNEFFKKKVSMKEIVHAYLCGEEWAKQVIKEASDKLALAISQAYTLFDIECVILGGGALSDIYPNLDYLAELLEQMVYPKVRPIILRKGKYGGNSQLVGATLFALDAIS